MAEEERLKREQSKEEERLKREQRKEEERLKKEKTEKQQMKEVKTVHGDTKAEKHKP